MRYLFDSRGRWIASEVAGRLHNRSGRNCGHYVARAEIFVDGQGRYLGEVTANDRLMHNKYSPHLFGYFGHFGYYGNVGKYSEPGKMGMIGLPMGFVDIDVTRLG